MQVRFISVSLSRSLSVSLFISLTVPCLHVRMHNCMCLYLCMYVCVCVFTHVCIYASMCLRIYDRPIFVSVIMYGVTVHLKLITYGVPWQKRFHAYPVIR